MEVKKNTNKTNEFLNRHKYTWPTIITSSGHLKPRGRGESDSYTQVWHDGRSVKLQLWQVKTRPCLPASLTQEGRGGFPPPLDSGTHLPKLPFSQLLLEPQLLPWELGHRDVLLGQRVHSEGRHSVRVVASHTLQADNVRLSVVRDVVLEALVWGALGDVWLRIITATGWRNEKSRVRQKATIKLTWGGGGEVKAFKPFHCGFHSPTLRRTLHKAKFVV